MTLRASGYSMYPYIVPGDICCFQPVPAKLKPGQIGLVVSEEGVLYSHRLHRIERVGLGIHYIFRGDAVAVCDAPVYRSQIIGTLVALSRGDSKLEEGRWPRRLWSKLAVHATVLFRPFVYAARRKLQQNVPEQAERGIPHVIGGAGRGKKHG